MTQGRFVQWLQWVSDSIQHSKFLDYSVNTGYFGIPVATFGLVTIALAVFVHVTFADEIQEMGERVNEQVSSLAQRATDMAVATEEVVTEEASRLTEERVGGEKRHKTVRRKDAYHGKTRKKETVRR